MFSESYIDAKNSGNQVVDFVLILGSVEEPEALIGTLGSIFCLDPAFLLCPSVIRLYSNRRSQVVHTLV
jgi:hypothetical protein